MSNLFTKKENAFLEKLKVKQKRVGWSLPTALGLFSVAIIGNLINAYKLAEKLPSFSLKNAFSLYYNKGDNLDEIYFGYQILIIDYIENAHIIAVLSILFILLYFYIRKREKLLIRSFDFIKEIS